MGDTVHRKRQSQKDHGGTYPAVSLKDARVKLDELKNKVLNGIDPIQEKKALKAIIEAKEIEVQTALATQFHLITYEWVSPLQSEKELLNGIFSLIFASMTKRF